MSKGGKLWFLVIVWVASIALSFFFGYNRADLMGYQMMKGSMYAGIQVLELQEQHQSAEAIKRLEDHCYAYAVMILSNGKAQHDPILKGVMVKLSDYKKRHLRENPSKTMKRFDALSSESLTNPVP